jgi:hypothetical protein
MKHSRLGGETRLGHPKKEFDFDVKDVLSIRLGHPKKEFDPTSTVILAKIKKNAVFELETAFLKIKIQNMVPR